MKDELAKFTSPEWSSWQLVNAQEASSTKIKRKFVVDDDYIRDDIEYGGVIARVKEPFLESIMNIFIRIIAGIIPSSDLKCGYVLNFGDMGQVDLFMASDVWSSHALISTEQPDKLNLLLAATREYIRYRCFVDSIQPH